MGSFLTRIVLGSFLFFFILSNFSIAATEQRTALVIGNSTYSTGPLKNPVNDAEDMAATLTKLGFTVTLVKNAKLQEMDEAIKAFGKSLKQGGVGLFFYAGHGVRVKGANYLIPVDARINKETDLKYKAVDANRVLDEMGHAQNGINIVILDACRDNPFARSYRSAARGLAIISAAPTGSYISYSTSPGNVARDGKGRNSPYTSALLSSMQQPGLSIEQVFKSVRVKLDKQTRGKQVPWELSSLENDFFFFPDEEKETAARDSGAKKAVVASDALDKEARKLEAEECRLEAEKAALEKWKALDEKRQRLEEEKARLDAERAAQRRAAEERKQTKAGTAPAMAPPANTFTSPTLGATFVLIPAGTFTMGAGDKTSSDRQHQVTISRSFYMQTTEVTQEQWKKLMGGNPSNFSGFWTNCDNCPVEQISWYDAQDFIMKLNKMEQTDKYRLPTEAQWEYAARSGGKQEKIAGSRNESVLGDYAWYGANSGNKTHPVGSKQPNGLGLYDMSGNAWEWVQDWWDVYPFGPVTDPVGPSTGFFRVIRGGSWNCTAKDIHTTQRFESSPPDLKLDSIGFRLVRTN